VLCGLARRSTVVLFGCWDVRRRIGAAVAGGDAGLYSLQERAKAMSIWAWA